MIEPARLLALLDKLRVEWAIDGARNPNLDWTPEFAYGVVHGRDMALQLIRTTIEGIIADEQEEE